MRLPAAPRFLITTLSLLVAVSVAAQSPVQQVQLVDADTLASLSWRSLASDAKGDGLHQRLPDAKELSYALDSRNSLVWFRVGVHERLPERWFGVNVAADNDDKPDNGLTWWGTNKTKFDRLASAYLFSADEYWQGVAGVADSEAAGRTHFTNLSRDVKVAVDREQRAILLGVPRSALGTAASIRVIATVGSMMVNNDDVPDEGAITITLR